MSVGVAVSVSVAVGVSVAVAVSLGVRVAVWRLPSLYWSAVSVAVAVRVAVLVAVSLGVAVDVESRQLALAFQFASVYQSASPLQLALLRRCVSGRRRIRWCRVAVDVRVAVAVGRRGVSGRVSWCC